MKYIKNTGVIFLLVIFMYGCTEPIALSYAEVINSNNIDITLSIYSKGEIIKDYFLKENQIIEISTNNYIGKGSQRGAGFINDYLSVSDSLIVNYNYMYKVVHYKVNPEVRTEKSIELENSRSFYDLENWNWTYEKKSKGKHINRYVFTFTESDYEFAKE